MSQRRYVPLWGKELATLRHAAGLTQAELAARAAVGRSTVSTWERMAEVDVRQPGPARILAALLAVQYRGCSPELLYVLAQARASASWALRAGRAQGSGGAGSKKPPKPVSGGRAGRAATRVPCAARTRMGTPCRMLAEPGAKRCRLHGGKSTGPRTPEGRARIAGAQRRRWSAWRASQQTPPAGRDEGNE